MSSATNLPSVWRNAIVPALGAYNSLDIGLTFIYLGSLPSNNLIADIHIGYSDIVDNGSIQYCTIASAVFPLGSGNVGNSTYIGPGRGITVNSSWSPRLCGGSCPPSVTSGQAVYNLVHELGHAIGFRHTNWIARREPVNLPSFPVGANQIPNTPTSDAASVFNGGTACSSWSNFSNFDVVALQTLFPPVNSCTNSPSSGWITSPIGNSVQGLEMRWDDLDIRWNTNRISNSSVRIRLYFADQLYQYSNYNQAQPSRSYFTTNYNTNGTVLDVTVPNSGRYQTPTPYLAHYQENILGSVATVESQAGGHPYRIRISDPRNECTYDFSGRFWITD